MLIEVVEYQSHWPTQFESIASRLRQAAGNLASSVDHIGSTAVPGLAAKPVIDVQVSMPNLEQIPELITAITGDGYIHRPNADDDRPPPWEDPDPTQWKKAYFRTETGTEPRVHIHAREVGRRNHRYALLFRDYLREHPRARHSYGSYKLQLSRLTAEHSGPGGTGAYLDMKDPILDLIADAAEKWAAETDWSLPTGDSGAP